MGEPLGEMHNDNDIVKLEEKNNDNDIVDGVALREKVLEEITPYKLDCLKDYLFGKNMNISDCGAFINPAIKQIERFMFVWINEVSEGARKSIVKNMLNGTNNKVEYRDYTNSPLWKYECSIFKLMVNFTCERCKHQYNPAHLVVHHDSYEHIGSEFDHMEDIRVLCTDCHMAVHGIRRKNGNK